MKNPLVMQVSKSVSSSSIEKKFNLDISIEPFVRTISPGENT